MISYVLLAFSIALGVIGQIFLKFAAEESSELWLINPLFNFHLLIALIIYFASVLLYTVSLRSLPLHIAFPSVSISYVLVAFLSSKIWGTPFGLREVFALLLIIIAIVILVSSEKSA